MNYQTQSPFVQSQMSYQPISGPATAVFQPGFAGTNVQEVQMLNHGYQPSSSTATYGGGMGYGAPVQSIFQPGFAGTNVQEVRHLNAGYPAPAISGFGSGMLGAQQSFVPAQSFAPSVQSIFQPGFAGTDVQEVRARNSGAYSGYALHSPFAISSQLHSMPMAQSYASMPSYGTPVNAIFQPGFAGTNPMDVQRDYALSQSTQQYPLYRTF